MARVSICREPFHCSEKISFPRTVLLSSERVLVCNEAFYSAVRNFSFLPAVLHCGKSFNLPRAVLLQWNSFSFPRAVLLSSERVLVYNESFYLAVRNFSFLPAVLHCGESFNLPRAVLLQWTSFGFPRAVLLCGESFNLSRAVLHAFSFKRTTRLKFTQELGTSQDQLRLGFRFKCNRNSLLKTTTHQVITCSVSLQVFLQLETLSEKKIKTVPYVF